LTEKYNCYIIDITIACNRRKDTKDMYIEIDFNSEEALYIQLRNQIIYGIATRQYKEGDALPSVRQLADTIGINMHTVNKAYAVLRQEGLLRLDRRRGAVIALDIDRLKAMDEMRDSLSVILARGCCKGISRQDVHQLVDEIFEEYE
jgi:DNA-binding transcriptional regulator YhcF (GntR family)